jgi:biopolymer transport protein ExbB
MRPAKMQNLRCFYDIGLEVLGLRAMGLGAARRLVWLGTAVLFGAAPGVAFAQAPAGDVSAAPSIAPMVATGFLPRDLSPWGMFLNADIVVKAVMVGLVFASVVTWTVWLAKSYELWSAKKKARVALGVLACAHSLTEVHEQFANPRDPVSRLVQSAILESQLSANTSAEGL